MPRSLRQRIKRLEKLARESKPADVAVIEKLIADRIRIDRELASAGVTLTTTPHGVSWLLNAPATEVWSSEQSQEPQSLAGDAR